MKIDEAIQKERETAEHSIRSMREYHEQIASWLEEYKSLKCDGIEETHGDCILACDVVTDTYRRSREHAIDEFVKEMGKFWGGMKAMDELEFVAKKLKEQK